MRFTYAVEVEVDREQGKFASKDDLNTEIEEALNQANPQEISGVGADGDSIYTVTEFTVTREES